MIPYCFIISLTYFPPMFLVVFHPEILQYLKINFSLVVTSNLTKTTLTHGLANTLRMRTAISPEQWQPWTAFSSPEAALLLVSTKTCKHNRLRPEPIRFVRLDSKHAQSDGKSVNRGLPVLDMARGRDSWC